LSSNNLKTQNMYNDFTDMPVWKAAMDIAVAVFKISIPLPRAEDYALKSQIRNSAESISADIAEGFGRFHSKDKINFYRYARGSAMETKSHLIYGNLVEYFDTNENDVLRAQIDTVVHDINKIIKTLQG